MEDPVYKLSEFNNKYLKLSCSLMSSNVATFAKIFYEKINISYNQVVQLAIIDVKFKINCQIDWDRDGQRAQ